MKRKTFLILIAAAPIGSYLVYKLGSTPNSLESNLDGFISNNEFELGFLDYKNAVQLKGMAHVELEKQSHNFLRTQLLSISEENPDYNTNWKNSYLENLDYIVSVQLNPS
ncbi:MAG: hypothetical protein AAGA10_30190 [Bacteroidota bacterium]